jgi:hypothetical protein
MNTAGIRDVMAGMIEAFPGERENHSAALD